jgi:hypothetical protein
MSKCVKTVSRIKPLLTIDKENIADAESYFTLFQNLVILEATTFLDEYNSHFFCSVLQTEKQRVKEFKRIVQPIINKINRWKDLKRFRNQIIAHNWRDKKGVFVIPDLNEFNIPRSRFEGVLLIDYLNYVWNLIQAEFQNDVNETFVHIASKIPKEKMVADYSNLNEELIEMAKEIDRLSQSLGKNYYLKVWNYVLED